MTDETPMLQAVPDDPEQSEADKAQLALEVQLAQSQEQEAMNATVNKHLNTRVVELRVQVNRLTKELEELKSGKKPRKAPQDRKAPAKKTKKTAATTRKKD